MSRPSVEHIQDIIKSLNKLADCLERDYRYYAENKSQYGKGTVVGSAVAGLSGGAAALLSLAGVALAPVIVPVAGVVAVGGAVVAGASGLAGYQTKVAEQSAYDVYLKLAQRKLSVYGNYLLKTSDRLGDKRKEDGDDSCVNNVLGILSPFIEVARFSIMVGGTILCGQAALAIVGAAVVFHVVTITFNVKDFVKNRVAAEQARKENSGINSALAMEIRKIADDLEQELRRQGGA
ncbi:uncharacterized protein LOC124274515 [Haliotis rubra]|uniref:uncharacterized protein LOC124274515 n=1 Tax=Haliotis rubra TaxID=36100 RepID=UPI001EE5D983|nr:uncharacterized protein LOC124274515 [Haliotis rubra]